MPLQYTAYTPGKELSEVLSWEVNPAHSRDTVTVAATTAALALGTVLGKAADGTIAVYTAAQVLGTGGAVESTQQVCGVLLTPLPISTSTAEAVMLARCSCVDKDGLVLASSLTTDQKTAAYAALTALGIVVR